MAPFYKVMVEELQAPFDQALYDAMVAKNEEELKKFDDKAVDAEQNQGETEINEAFLSKADYYAKIGDKVSSSFAVHVKQADTPPPSPSSYRKTLWQHTRIY